MHFQNASFEMKFKQYPLKVESNKSGMIGSMGQLSAIVI